MRFTIHRFFKRHRDCAASSTHLETASTTNLQTTLEDIVQDVVNALGYVGAMVATYEQGDTLPVRALSLDPRIATLDDLHRWEQQVSQIIGEEIRILDPNIARVYVYDETYKDNLSVIAVTGGGPVTSNDLYDLFRPIAPLATRPLVQTMQRAMGIQQVIAVPFFLESQQEGEPVHEVVGNLFAAKRGPITEQDIRILSAFGRQAAAAIGSERRRLQIEVTQELVFRMQSSLQDEAQILQWIAHWLVDDLGYVGAMVAPYESDDSLPVYAMYVDPQCASSAQIEQWERQVSQFTDHPVSISDRNVARVYVQQDPYSHNLSVRAAATGAPVTSNELYDLLRPIVPLAAKPIVHAIQQSLDICQVIAVPFFLEAHNGERVHRELYGNLFAATRSRTFRPSEIALLRAVGQQAAIGLHNARLYHRAREQRQAAQLFSRMAFNASRSVHALSNHLSVLRMHLTLLERLPPAERDALLTEKSPQVQARVEAAANLLSTLRAPWQQVSDEATDVNDCLRGALNRAFNDREGTLVAVTLDLTDTPLPVQLAPEMLTEAFRVIINNAIDAIPPQDSAKGKLRLRTWLEEEAIHITIEDNGSGIRPEHLRRIFDIGWTTKETGIGFGLFWTKDYIEGLGGAIKVESQVGEGTRFTLTLPLSANISSSASG
ncbi:MAG TPA: sensor histidine kinase [Chloroflexi bacterium]|nr:sensor histidine kinase [Chloroflexota bacterium]